MSSLKHDGKAYWQSLAELDGSEAAARRSTEGEVAALLPPTSRRHFLGLMSASLALAGAGLAGCRRWPERQLAPYVDRPEGEVPGATKALATAFELGGVARPVVATCYDGRPIKLEGNAAHPLFAGHDAGIDLEHGPTDLLTQAAILEMYDPERSRAVLELEAGGRRRRRRWEDFTTALGERGASLQLSGGAGLAVLGEATSSPSLLRLQAELKARMPAALWAEWEPVSWDTQREGTRRALGEPLVTRLHLDRAEVVACFDADILVGHPAALVHARDFAKTRRSADRGAMSRLYVVENGFSITGANADERLALCRGEVGLFVAALAQRLGVELAAKPAALASTAPWLERLAIDLQAHRGRSLVTAGQGQPPEVHALCDAINVQLGNVGHTVTYARDVRARPAYTDALAEITGEMHAGRVSTLLLLGGNPVYDAPADLDFAAALASVPFSVHCSLYDNETSRRCRWHVNRAHWLESWGDARAVDGTVSLVQPAMAPLFQGHTSLELLGVLAGEPRPEPLAMVRATHRALIGSTDDETRWRRALHDGFVPATAFAALVDVALTGTMALPPPPAAGLELAYYADTKVYDGRFANNGWLQELPDPMTTLTWDNAALMAPATAQRLGLTDGDLVELSAGGRTLEVAVLRVPGHAAGSVSLALGYGRSAAGHVGDGVGFDAFRLRLGAGLWLAGGVALRPLGKRHSLAFTQSHFQLDRLGEQAAVSRAEHLLPTASLAAYRETPYFAGEHHDKPLQLWKEPVAAEGNQWGMAVDLNACIGCGACELACQAENNVPIVGKALVAMGREMHWLRLDRYYQGPPEAPRVVHQPMLCHHCENAPCEQVCPVAATVHDSDGLNVQVYNRCVGTRYCSNNCPYKVRRFNYFDFHAGDPRGGRDRAPHLGMPDSQPHEVDPVKQLAFNPEVTVRMRGVMEKCTFCLQRVRAAKARANNEESQGLRGDHDVRDGEVLTACQQVCPTQAIVFGDVSDPDSRVSRLQRNNRAFALLAELNTRPRLQYLAKITNPQRGS